MTNLMAVETNIHDKMQHLITIKTLENQKQNKVQQNSWKIPILLSYYYQLFSWDQEGDMMSLILFLLYTVQQIKAKLSESKGAKKLLFFSNSTIIYAENPKENKIIKIDK